MTTAAQEEFEKAAEKLAEKVERMAVKEEPEESRFASVRAALQKAAEEEEER